MESHATLFLKSLNRKPNFTWQQNLKHMILKKMESLIFQVSIKFKANEFEKKMESLILQIDFL